MNIFQAAVLGLVQGLAEFLPISSSGHLILARLLMGISDVEADTGKYIIFDVLLHAGTLLAVVVVFWKDWWGILKNPFKSKTLLLLIIASLPALVVVVLFNDFVEQFFTGWFGRKLFDYGGVPADCGERQREAGAAGAEAGLQARYYYGHYASYRIAAGREPQRFYADGRSVL